MMYEIKPLDITTADFLGAFYAPDETVNLQIYSDRDDRTFKGLKHSVTPAEFAKSVNLLSQHNAANRAIAFIVNKGGYKGEEISEVKALFVEIDNASFDEQLARIQAFPVEPSVMVKTRKSLHTYWLVDDVSPDEFSHLQKRLVAQFGGDGNCVNKNRAMRLPGFNHCKQEPLMVQCVKFTPTLRYKKAQLTPHLPEVAQEAKTQANDKKPENRRGLDNVLNRCDFMKHCRDNAATLSEHDWYAMISNLVVFEGGVAAVHALSKAYQKYSYDDTQGKIAHFVDSGTAPITCRVIGEKGFKCPKLANGGCACKSPAALAFKPLTTTELLENLNSLEKHDSVLENIQVATRFIQECLYNIDAPTAETLIQHDLKTKFDFKATDLAPLIKLYREVAKKYGDSKAARQQKAEDSEQGELPPWYEVTEKGAIRFLPGILAEDMAKNEHIFYSAEQYYVYENGVYNAVNDLTARNIVKSHLIPRYTVLNNITDTDGQWRMMIQKLIREVNANPYIINVRNGLYNVQDGSFSEHTPSCLSTVQLNVNYTPDAKCPRFMQFLHEALDEPEIYLLQEIFGYFLIPINKAQKSFVIVGEPGAGKSKLLLTLNEVLLGQQNVSNIAWQNLNERFKMAELYGKLANIFADLPTKGIDDNGIFKALVGEDFLTAERKNKDPFTFQSYARLLFSCNSIPRNFGDKSEGFYRKLIIIRFAKPVPEERRDAELLDKFKAEADGIFMFAVEGLKRLIANGFKFSETEATRAELQRYRVDSNSVLSFVEDFCAIAPEHEVERNELYEKYKDYCKTAGLTAMSQKSFNKDLELSNPNIKRSVDRLGKRRTWKGIKIDTDV